MKTNNRVKTLFSKSFFWGAATSAHQVEGHNYNNWSVWEKSAERVAQLRLTHPTGSIEDYFSGEAADHYNRYKEDLSLAKKLGHNAFRLSIEWSRIEPEEGKFDYKEIKHYQDVTDYCIKLGITPIVTLWHWTSPVWMAKYNYFESKNSVKLFSRYVSIVCSQLPKVHNWLTVNEPEIYTDNSYIHRRWPPQKASWKAGILVFRNLIKAHKEAYTVIKKLNPAAQVGIATNNSHFEAGNKNIDTLLYTKLYRYINNELFLRRIQRQLDFIGLNYYFHSRIIGHQQVNENEITSDLGWELYPQGIYNAIAELKKYHKPIMITENGLADRKDSYRAWFIEETIKAIQKAISDGHNVIGYLHWSLLDNFEWADGFSPRFGLIEIDYKTQKRTIRKSALKYSEIIRSQR